ncbi:MAG: ZIP family metal transporter [Myxococcales bacterium]|nr:ZIP family metal transporter [Myxococcales bacterium]MCB9581170.1 ZIP family metal transporter [Polyangiaceae bacterium]
MSDLAWIVASGLAMAVLSLVGAITLALSEDALKMLLLPLVALSAGALLGGALFHMLPAAVEAKGGTPATFAWAAAGFSVFFVMEQFLHWHHCHRSTSEHTHPLTHLLLLAGGVHKLLGGLAVGAAFLVRTELGISAWLAAAAHEVPQYLGDFGVLLHGGWTPRRALGWLFGTSLPFLVGGLAAYATARQLDVAALVPFAAGNFIYIAASDLIPEIKHHERLARTLFHFLCFVIGLAILYGLALGLHHGH